MNSVGNTARDRCVSGTDIRTGPLAEVIEIAETLHIANLELWIPHNFRWDELSTVGSRIVSKRGLRAVVISTLDSKTESSRRHQSAAGAHQTEHYGGKSSWARSVNTYFGANPQRHTGRSDQELLPRQLPHGLDLAIRENIYITLENEFEPSGSDITRGLSTCGGCCSSCRVSGIQTQL